jgi:hypothetical protein
MPRPINFDPKFLAESKAKENARKTKDYNAHRLERRYKENEARYKKRMLAKGLPYVQRPMPPELIELLEKKEEVKKVVEKIMKQPEVDKNVQMVDVEIAPAQVTTSTRSKSKSPKQNVQVYKIKGVTEAKAIEIVNKRDVQRKYGPNIKLLFGVTKIKFLHEFYQNFDQNVKKVLNATKEDGKPYSDSYRQECLIALSVATEMCGLIPYLPPSYREKYDKLKGVKKVAENAVKFKRGINKNKQTIPRYINLHSVIYDKYGNKSVELLFSRLFQSCPARNDFHKMKIVEEVPKEKEKNINYIVLPKNKKNEKILLLDYKTIKTYGPIEVELPKMISNQLRKEFKIGDFPFKKFTGAYVKKMFQGTKYADKINTFSDLRKSIVSSLWQNETIPENKKIEMKAKLAYIMGHSVEVAGNTYNVPLEKDEEEEKDES